MEIIIILVLVVMVAIPVSIGISELGSLNKMLLSIAASTIGIGMLSALAFIGITKEPIKKYSNENTQQYRYELVKEPVYRKINLSN